MQTTVKMYSCGKCSQSFSRVDNLRRHERQSCKGNNSSGPSNAKQPRLDIQLPTWCNCCNISVNNQNAHRRTLQHRTNACIYMGEGIQRIDSAFKCRIVSYRVESDNSHVDYNDFFCEIKPRVLMLLENILSIHRAVKVNVEAYARYYLHTKEVFDLKCFNTPNRVVEESADLDEIYELFRDAIISQTTEFQERDSGM